MGSARIRNDGQLRVIQSVDRVLDILEGLAEHPDESTLSSIAVRVALKPATTRGLLVTMMRRGYVVQERDRGGYHLGPKLPDLAVAMEGRPHLRSVALPVLEWLHQSSGGELVSLGVFDNFRLTVIARIFSSHSLSITGTESVLAPGLHVTAQGKVALASLPKAALDAHLQSVDLGGFGPRAIRDADTLLKNLAEVRQKGYAVTVDEVDEGRSAVAAPIWRSDHRLLATVAVSLPTVRFIRTGELGLVNLVTEAAARIQEKLGYPSGKAD